MTSKSKRSNKCRFCNKGFTNESTLLSHMCVKKKRYNDRNTIGAKLGFRVYQRFFELTTSSKKPKSVEDFIDSKYYKGFVKFGRYISELKPINNEMYIDYLIQNSVKLKDWCRDDVYEIFVKEFSRKEPAEKALERSIIYMSSWCDKKGVDLSEYFNTVSTFEATHAIKMGRLSPWILYLASKSDDLLSSFNEEQAAQINDIIDPKYWKAKFNIQKEDMKFVMETLEAGNI